MKQKLFIISKQLKVRKDHPGCILVFDSENDFFYELNDIGSEIFLLIEKALSVKEILEELKKKYEAPPTKLEKEFDNFIKRLIKLKIIYERK